MWRGGTPCEPGAPPRAGGGGGGGAALPFSGRPVVGPIGGSAPGPTGGSGRRCTKSPAICWMSLTRRWSRLNCPDRGINNVTTAGTCWPGAGRDGASDDSTTKLENDVCPLGRATVVPFPFTTAVGLLKGRHHGGIFRRTVTGDPSRWRPGESDLTGRYWFAGKSRDWRPLHAGPPPGSSPTVMGELTA